MATFTATLTHIFHRLLPAENYINVKNQAKMPPRPKWLASLVSASSSQSPKASTFQSALLSVLLAIPVLIYYITIYKNAYSFPYEDDFNSALSFIGDYAFGGLTAGKKLKLIFSQYNEHRIVFDRLVFLADYGLFGQLNFRHLILIGNLAPLLIGFLFLKVAFKNLPLSQKLLYLLPVAYSLFSFQYWELSTWSMAALQNLYVIPFALFSLYSLTQPGRPAFVLACGAAILATFTSGNGMFAFIVGIPILLLLKSYRNVIVWVLISAVTLGIYFWDYTRPPYHPDIVDSLINHTGRAVSYFLSLTGALVGPGRPKLAMLFGVLLLVLTLGLLGHLWYKKRLTAQLPLLGWLLFLYLTCLSLMASRSGMGVDQAFTPRYGIVVVMLFSTQAVLMLEVVKPGYLRLGVLAAYLTIVLYVYLSPTNQGNRQRLEDRTRQLYYSSAFYNDNPANLYLHWGNSDVAKTFFGEAARNGIYQVPNLTFRDLKSTPHPFEPNRLVDTHTMTYEVKPYNTSDFLVLYRSWALVNGSLPKQASIQVVARSSTTSYVFDTQKHIWDDTNDHILRRTYTHPGFSCVLDKKDLKPGHYELWLCLTDGESKAYQPLAIGLDI